MKPCLFLFALLLCIPALISAQTPTFNSNNDSLIKVRIVKNGINSNVIYTLNDKLLNNSDLKLILSTYPKSANEIKNITDKEEPF